MTFAEQQQYFGNLARMSAQDWMAQSAEQKQNDVNNTVQGSANVAQAGVLKVNEIDKETEAALKEKYKAQGLSDDEIKARVDADMGIYRKASSRQNEIWSDLIDEEEKKKGSPLTAEERQELRKASYDKAREELRNNPDMDPYLRQQALASIDAKADVAGSTLNIEKIEEAKPGSENKLATTVIGVSQDIHGATVKYGDALTAKGREIASAQADAAVMGGSKLAEAGADVTAVKDASTVNFVISKNKDAALATADPTKLAAVDNTGGLGEDEPTPTKTAEVAAPFTAVAAAAPRLTVNGAPLAAAGQLAQDTGTYVAQAPVVANDPAANDPAIGDPALTQAQLQAQRRPASGSPGMTA